MTNSRSKDEILDTAIKEIIDMAFKDGIVDDREWELINQIEISIEDYADSLDRALLDGVITPEESEELETLKNKILEDASSIANEDGVIDEEEANILQILLKIVEKYRTE